MHDAAPFQPADLERHRSFLQRLARELVRGEHAAEDLVQEAFVRALERPPESARALRAWLGRVMRNLAVNRGRSRRRAAERELRAARPEALAPHDEALADLELQERLIAAVKALAEPYRTTLWLRFHEGLAPAAIAAREQASKRTVESRLARGLALVREELDRRSGGDRTQWLGGVLALARQGSRPWIVPLTGVAAMKLLWIAGPVLVALVLVSRLGTERRAPVVAEPAHATAAQTPSASAVAPVSAAEEKRAPVGTVSTPVAASEPDTALNIRVRWSDGTAAPDVGLFVFPEDDPLGERHVVCTRTDGEGRARVESLHPGAVRIETDRGAELATEVAVGRQNEVVLDLPAGVCVEGTVAEASGAPVAGAEVLLMRDGTSWLAARVATLTAPNGAYRIRDVSPELSVSARAGSFVPAELAPLRRHAPGTVASIDLWLAFRGVGLHGRVLDPDLRPVQDALIAVGDAAGYYEQDQETGLGAEHRGMRTVTSDVQGRFQASGVDMTRGLPFAVLAEGFPVAIGGVAGTRDTSSFVEIVLAQPCTVFGTVRDPLGQPIVGASVRVISLAGVQARDIPFALPRAASDAEGRYRLELVPPGVAGLSVDPPERAALGARFDRVTLAAGANALDFVLSHDASIRGRVIDARGRPALGSSVYAFSIGGTSRIQKVRTDGEGAFTLARCTQPPYVLDVLDTAGRRLLRVREVGPSPEELVMHLAEPGSLRGVFVEEGEASGELLEAYAVRAGAEHGFTGEWNGNRFAFPVLPPGRYRLMIRAGERDLHRTSWLSVAAGEHIDLGTIHRARPGSLHVELDPPPPGGIGIVLLDRSFEIVDLLRDFDERLAATGIVAGSYFLRVDADERASHLEPVEIRPGEETRVTIRLASGVARTLSFSVDPAAEWNRIRVALRDELGRTCFGRREERYARTPSVLAVLAPGTYALEAETDTGLAAHGSFTVEALAEQDSPLVFELR